MKMKIKISNEIKEKVPQTKLAVLKYTADVKETSPELWEYMDETIIPQINKKLEIQKVTEFKNVASSRKAYKAFGKDPGRYRVSSEALIRRIKQGKELYKINTVVDTNNLISVESGFSAGSYDIDCVNGDITLNIGKAGESYKGIGKDSVNIENLPVLCDDEGPFGSPTSDSEKAMIGLNSKNIITLIYSFSDDENLSSLLDKAAEYLKKYAGAKNIEKLIIE
jgi:DNA/RNA-binding domain of Phe-tRNA-synthetase-like protein